MVYLIVFRHSTCNTQSVLPKAIKTNKYPRIVTSCEIKAIPFGIRFSLMPKVPYLLLRKIGQLINFVFYSIRLNYESKVSKNCC